jgi:hypothetical protein
MNGFAPTPKALQRSLDDIAAARLSDAQAATSPGQASAAAAISPIGDRDRNREEGDANQIAISVETARPPFNRAAAHKLSIPARIEELAERYEAINFGVISLLAAFLLVFGSYMTGVLDVEYTALHKQVGFGWAPNWSFNYLVLFVAYNCLLCTFANRIREILKNLAAQRGVVNANGLAIRNDRLWSHYRDNLRGISPILWMLNLGVPFVCIKQWLNDCYQPLQQNSLSGRPVDWTNIAIVQPTTTTTNAEMWFTGISYSYMAVSLWIYLFVLLYAAAFAWYMSRLSRGVGGLRLVIQH